MVTWTADCTCVIMWEIRPRKWNFWVSWENLNRSGNLGIAIPSYTFRYILKKIKEKFEERTTTFAADIRCYDPYTRKKWTTWSTLSTTCCNIVLHPFNNFVLHPVNNCFQQPLFTVVHVQQPLFNHCWERSTSLFINYCQLLFQQHIVTTNAFCQYWTTIDRTILNNIVNSTSVVEP